MTIRFKRLNKNAIIPTRANSTDAGLDIYSLEDVTIPACTAKTIAPWDNRIFVSIGQAKIQTGIAVEIPLGYYGKVSSRSGLAFNQGIFGFDGTVDSLYRGEIGVLLFNSTDKPYQVKKGDRVAQLLIIPCAILQPIEADELTESDRGNQGFGSSGR